MRLTQAAETSSSFGAVSTAPARAVARPALRQQQQQQQAAPPAFGQQRCQVLTTRRRSQRCGATPPGGSSAAASIQQQLQGRLESLAGSAGLQRRQQPAARQGAQTAPDGNGAGAQPQQQEEDVLIEFKDVWKSFGSKHILRGASFKIRRGEAVGIIGSSGTGKSTTLRLAAGLLEPDRGEVIIKGEPRQGLISDDDTSNKLKVGLVFQSGALFDSLTVGENVGFLLREHTDIPENRINALVAESLGKVGLSGVEDLYPSELSGGMKKRVALARAIVRDDLDANPVEQVIMYDEPTAGLDPVASTVVEDLIRDLHDRYGSHHADPAHTLAPEHPAGITSYVVVTHQHSTIRRAVDRIIFLHEGRVVWEGTTAEFDSTDEPIVRQFASGDLRGPIMYV